MIDIPFPHRVLALLLVLAAISCIEWWLRRGQAVRWRYSLVALAAGLGGAVYGAAHDAITVQMAPEYFSLLKGLGNADVHGKASALGAQAGFSIGVISAAALACAGERRRTKGDRPDLRALVRACMGVARMSIGFAVIGGLGSYLVLQQSWAGSVLPAASDGQGRAAVNVWVIHACTYLGAGVGMVTRTRALLLPRRQDWPSGPSPPGA